MKRTSGILTSLVFFASFASTQSQETVVQFGMTDSVVISKSIYGHFAEHLGHCIYGGIWVGERSTIPNTRGIRNDVVAALRKIRIPVVRWPGGCFADDYHWMEGIGPAASRPKLVNTTWGGVTEDNSFGTHEFMDFCEQTGAEPYICGNIRSGTVKEMSDWVQYLTSDGDNAMAKLRRSNGREKPWTVKFWAMGNETWGCGGIMPADFYASELGRYSTSLKNFEDSHLYKVASGGLPEDYNWTETIMKKWSTTDGWLQGYMSGYSLHFYAVTNWEKKGPATQFDEAGWFTTLAKTWEMDALISKHSAIMDKYDPKKRIGLVVDEWGTWYDVESGTNPSFLYQQNTMRDAVAAAINLNIFNNHADRVKMANIAQLVNVLQSLILTDGAKMVLTPTYYVFDLFKVHQNALRIPATLEAAEYAVGDKKMPAVSCSASVDEQRRVHVSLANADFSHTQKVALRFARFTPVNVSGKVLDSGRANDFNSFEHPDVVAPKAFSDFSISAGNLVVALPPASVVVLELEGKNE